MFPQARARFTACPSLSREQTARPLLGAGGDERLHVGVGEHHGADVAALDDATTVHRDPGTLPRNQRLTHARVRGDRRDRGRDLRPPNLLAHVASVENGADLPEEKALEAAKVAPDVRIDRVQEVKRKLLDPSYPSEEIIEKTADGILKSFGI